MLLTYLMILYQLGVTSSTVVPTDGSPPTTCNMCCQGPAGLPGIPGAAGAAGAAGIPGSCNNGLPGRDGLRGEAGNKGDRGERGEMGVEGPLGPQGPSGDRGEQGSHGLQGLPGKTGPRGIDGITGADGRTGPIGLKGQKGETASNRRSAFSVGKTVPQVGNAGETLTFDHVETNIGNPYSSTNHRFTCQIAGTYVFMFTIASGSASHDPYVDLVKDGTGVARAVVRETDGGGSMYLQSSQSVVLQLAVGNQVWLRFGSSGETVYSDSSKLTTFAAFLLYED